MAVESINYCSGCEGEERIEFSLLHVYVKADVLREQAERAHQNSLRLTAAYSRTRRPSGLMVAAADDYEATSVRLFAQADHTEAGMHVARATLCDQACPGNGTGPWDCARLVLYACLLHENDFSEADQKQTATAN